MAEMGHGLPSIVKDIIQCFGRLSAVTVVTDAYRCPHLQWYCANLLQYGGQSEGPTGQRCARVGPTFYPRNVMVFSWKP